MEEDFISEGLSNFISYNYTYSLQMFNKADSIKSNSDIKFYQGMCHMKLGDYENAIKEFNDSNLKGNASFELFFNRGLSHLYNGDLVNSKKDLSEALILGNERQKKTVELHLLRIS